MALTNNWQVVPLGTLTENYDAIRIPVKESDRRPGPYPYYGASGIVDSVDDYIFDGEYLLIAEDGENLRTKKTPIAFLATGKFWVNNHAHIVKGNEQADTRFLMYALSLADVGAYLTGSTMPKLTQANLNRIPIYAPPIDEQRAIAAILSSLDDKIELNRRMNYTLEQMAQALFKSWFVDFDPIHANREGQAMPGLAPEVQALFPDEFEDSPMGELPKGWRVVPLGNVITIHDAKRVPLSNMERAKRQGQYPYYGAASAMDYVDDYLFDGVYVLMGEDGSVCDDNDHPVIQYVWGKFWVNNHAHVLTSKEISNEHLLLFLQQTNIKPYVTGAVQPKLNQANMCRVPFLLADRRVNDAFREVLSPLYALIRANSEQTRTLVSLRDALLPKLLSGELRVRDAEKVVVEAQ